MDTGGLWADQWQAGDSASDTGAAMAGVGGGREGVTVAVDNTLVQAGVTDGTAGIRGDGMGALDWTRSLLTVHHLVLIRSQRDKEGRHSAADGNLNEFPFIEKSQTDQTGALRAGVGGRSEGSTGLIFFAQMATNPCAERAALPRRGHRMHTGNSWTRHMCAHHSTILDTHTRTHISSFI